MNIRRIFKNRNLFRIINSSIKDHEDIFLKNRRIYRSSNQTDKLRNSRLNRRRVIKKKKEGKKTSSPKLSPTNSYQILRHRGYTFFSTFELSQ